MVSKNMKKKILGNIPSGQEQKKRNAESLPCCEVTGNVLKYEAAKYNINVTGKQTTNKSQKNCILQFQ